MRRRDLLMGTGLASLGVVAAAQGVPPAAASAASAPALPGVLSRPAQATHLATRSALLGATRAGQRLLLCGERGIVLWSDDQGQRWKQARVPVQVSLTALAFADDAREGWACGHFGVLLHTRDGGENWTLALDGAAAARLQSQSASGEAQRRLAQRHVDEGPDKPFFDVALVQGRAVAVGAYGLAVQGKDSDRAAFTPLGPQLPNPKQLHLYAACAHGTQLYVAGEQGLLLRSSDGGGQFDAMATPYKGSFFGLLLPADGAVLAYGLRGNIWRSADRGDTWTRIANPLPANLGAGVVLDDGRTVLLAQNGDLLVSTDQGQRFEHRPAAHPFPAATLVATADGRHAVLAGLRGLQRVAL